MCVCVYVCVCVCVFVYGCRDVGCVGARRLPLCMSRGSPENSLYWLCACFTASKKASTHEDEFRALPVVPLAADRVPPDTWRRVIRLAVQCSWAPSHTLEAVRATNASASSNGGDGEEGDGESKAGAAATGVGGAERSAFLVEALRFVTADSVWLCARCGEYLVAHWLTLCCSCPLRDFDTRLSLAVASVKALHTLALAPVPDPAQLLGGSWVEDGTIGGLPVVAVRTALLAFSTQATPSAGMCAVSSYLCPSPPPPPPPPILVQTCVPALLSRRVLLLFFFPSCWWFNRLRGHPHI